MNSNTKKAEETNTNWKFRAHLGMSKGKSLRMEVKTYLGIEMFRESGSGKPIYYISSDKRNFSTESELRTEIEKLVTKE